MADAYGWRKKWILEDVYFDELYDYIQKIRIRKVSDYMMQLSISQNPHIEDEEGRRALWDKLNSLLEDKEPEEVQPEFDKSGMESLKLLMSSNPRIIVK